MNPPRNRASRLCWHEYTSDNHDSADCAGTLTGIFLAVAKGKCIPVMQ